MVDLYALPPEEFTAARDAAAKQARADGDRDRAAALRALRRPTASAHLLNLLVRSQPGLVAQLRDLGRELAAAQEQGRGDALRALGEQRRALVAAVAEQVVDGHDASAAVRAEVEATLEAALADPAAGDAVMTGRLVRPLSYAGFGGVALDDAVGHEAAAPAAQQVQAQQAPTQETPAQKTPAPKPRRSADARHERAEQAALEAAGRLDDAVRATDAARRTAEQRAQEAEQVRSAAGAAVDAREQAETEVARLREELAQAEQRARETSAAEREAAKAVPAAERRERAAARALGAAEDEVAEAQEAAQAARAALDALRRTSP